VTLQGPENYVCQHVLRPESNVVVEVQVCKYGDVKDHSIRIAGGIADNVIDMTR
jgi:PknH-like extracellular domain